MLTRRNRALLAAADPWGLETGGCPGLGDRSDSWTMHGYGLGAVNVPIVGSDIESTGKAGEKIIAALEAGDVNAVAEGMEEGLDAVESGAAKLGKAWSDAAKFFMLLGPTVTAPIIGAKVAGKAAAAGIRLPMWGFISKAKIAQVNAAGGTIQAVQVSTAQDFMDLVAQGWLFPDAAWEKIGLANPLPGGVYGQVWNPFSGRWQASDQPLPQVGSTEAIAQEAVSTAYQGDVLQRDVDKYAKNMPGYLSLAALRVRAEKYSDANTGTIYAGQNPWGMTVMIIVLTGRGGAEFADPNGEVSVQTKDMIANYKVSFGPLKGASYKRLRIKWIKRLQTIVAEEPADARPPNAAVLAAATVDGWPGSTLVSEATADGSPKTQGFGAGAVAVAGAGMLGLLWFLLA